MDKKRCGRFKIHEEGINIVLGVDVDNRIFGTKRNEDVIVVVAAFVCVVQKKPTVHKFGYFLGLAWLLCLPLNVV